MSDDATVEKMRDSVTQIFKSALDDLKQNCPKELPRDGEKRFWFPDGVNYIEISLTAEPAKVGLVATLKISSQPIKASTTSEKNAEHQ